MSKRLDWTGHVCILIFKEEHTKLNGKIFQQKNDRPTEYFHNKISYQSTQNNKYSLGTGSCRYFG